MSALAVGLPAVALPVPDALPAELRAAVREYTRATPLPWHRPPAVTPALRACAASLAAQVESWAAPASVELVRAWMLPLAGAVRRAPRPADFELRCATVAFACGDLPGWVFNEGTLRAAMQRFASFPAAADVRAVLVRTMRPMMAMAGALRAIADAPPAPEEQTAEDRAREACAVRAIMAAWEAERTSNQRTAA